MRLHFQAVPAAAIAALLACVAVGRGDDPPRDHDITIDDYFTLAAIGEPAISPDGTQVAYVERRWAPPAQMREGELWVVATAGGAPRRLTFEAGDESSPQWSADGKFLYYLVGRTRGDGKLPPADGKRQVWRLAVDSGVESPVTQAESGVDAFEITREGGAVFYSVSKETSDDAWKPLQEKFGDLEFGEGKRKVSEIWKLDLATWRAEKVIDRERYVHEFSVAPGGRRLAMITTEDDELISLEGRSNVDVFDFTDGKIKTLNGSSAFWRAPSPFGWLTSPAWSPSGNKLAFAVSFDGYSTELFVAAWGRDAAEPDVEKLDRATEMHPEDRVKWAGEQELAFVGHHRARRKVYAASKNRAGLPDVRELTPGDVVVSDFDVSHDGKLAVVKGDPASLPDLYVSEGAPPSRRLTDANPQAKRWKLPQVSVVKWAGADGKEVEGILELPPDHKEGTRLPLVLEIHGGPTSATPYAFGVSSEGAGLFSSRGYARLSPNYRGSLGYGDEFLTDLVGRENDIEVKDLIAGVDAMIDRGIADPEKLAVMGWSNGGFLTAAVIAADTRFKAASCGAGVVDQFLQWGTEDTPGHVINFMGGKLPWEAPEAYQKASPIYGLGDATTPTLIHVGENDERVPADHARALYRALRRYRGVPTQLVVYPGEGHGLSKLENRRAKMEWDAAWFDHYALGKPLGGK